MAKASAPKKKKPRPKLTDKEQSERFIQTARQLGVDEAGKDFEKATEKLLVAKSNSGQNLKNRS
jgi:hypothetical protein